MSSSFAVKSLVAVMVFFAFIVVALPSVGFLASPVRRPAELHWWLVGASSTFSDDGEPQLRTLRQYRMDAWLKYEAIGRQVFVRRLPGSHKITAFPTHHLSNGIPVRIVYDDKRRVFHSVCRGVDFHLDGRLQDAAVLRIYSEDLTKLPVKEESGMIFVMIKQ